MRIICAWCKKPMGEKEPINDNRITHAICEECSQKVKQELKQAKGEKK